MLQVNLDKRGKLIAINDVLNDVPFPIKRFMEISSVPEGETRGYHAHKTNEQLLLCFAGRIIIKTEKRDQSGQIVSQSHELNEGDFLYMPPLTWAEQTYHDRAVLHVLCSKKFEESDYIRDYEEFKEY